jgi:uncharacterized protein YdaT
MYYSEDNYPSEMKQLKKDVRKKAIKFTNEMLIDNDVRYHEDFIIKMAIEKAKLWAVNHQKEIFVD